MAFCFHDPDKNCVVERLVATLRDAAVRLAAWGERRAHALGASAVAAAAAFRGWRRRREARREYEQFMALRHGVTARFGPRARPRRDEWTPSMALAVFAVLAAAFAVFAAPKPAMATEIQPLQSAGGVEAWLVEEQSLPFITIQLGFQGGASIESPSEGGLARLFAGMLEEGAGPYDSTGFAAARDAVAARLSFSAGQDTLTVSATMLTESMDESLELLRLALTEPRFDAEPLAIVKGQLISQIRQNDADPNSLGARAWFADAFPGHVYGRSTYGTEETVSALTADQLRAAMPRLLNRNAVKVGVVGAITADEVGPILDALLGGLPAAPVDPIEKVTPTPSPGVSVVDFDAPQSTVIFGHEGIKRNDPDFIPAFVMNYVLGGGGFSSRLMQEVREKRGLAYGVYSYLAPYDRAGLYLGGVGTENDRVAESIEVIRAEWARLAADGVTDEELDAAKTYLTGAYPLRFDTNAKIANFLVGAQMEDLGLDYINVRNDLVLAVTSEDIQRVAARLLQPDALSFVVVGKPTGL